MNRNNHITEIVHTEGTFNGDTYVSVKTVAELYDIKPDTLRKWLQKRLLPSYNIRGLVRIKLSDLELMIVRKPSKKEVVKNLLKIV
ncbi:MAG: helix-turn-helix domain-containing protein [bacterium]|nr:helix-turn-helix domain-containing protein [bacterium]